MIGRKEKSKEKKYREDETDNDNINLKDSPKLIKVFRFFITYPKIFAQNQNPDKKEKLTPWCRHLSQAFPDKK